jgi:hypothetical protein
VTSFARCHAVRERSRVGSRVRALSYVLFHVSSARCFVQCRMSPHVGCVRRVYHLHVSLALQRVSRVSITCVARHLRVIINLRFTRLIFIRLIF